MPSDPIQTFIDGLTDQQLLAVMLLAEARGEDALGRQMVANVVMNRIAWAKAHEAKIGSTFWWGDDIRSVILKPWQFSSFNESDPNRRLLPSFLHHPLTTEALQIASMAIGGNLPDHTGGADSYLNPKTVEAMPNWATPDRLCAQHLRHSFYRTH